MYLLNLLAKLKNKSLWRSLSVVVLLAVIYYFFLNSGVGDKAIIEEGTSIITSLLLITLFVIKRVEIKVFYWLGIFSYEIYMFHWPLMYRYDFLFKYLPAWLALSLYFFVFIGLGFLLKTAIEKGSRFFVKK